MQQGNCSWLLESNLIFLEGVSVICDDDDKWDVFLHFSIFL